MQTTTAILSALDEAAERIEPTNAALALEIDQAAASLIKAADDDLDKDPELQDFEKVSQADYVACLKLPPVKKAAALVIKALDKKPSLINYYKKTKMADFADMEEMVGSQLDKLLESTVHPPEMIWPMEVAAISLVLESLNLKHSINPPRWFLKVIGKPVWEKRLEKLKELAEKSGKMSGPSRDETSEKDDTKTSPGKGPPYGKGGQPI